jgi:hypothetical protein
MLALPPHLLHFAAWWTLLALAPLLWALRRDSAMRRDERVYRLTFIYAPMMLGLVWLHGLLFDVPQNLGDARGLEAVALWFRPHALPFYSEHRNELLAIAAPGVLTALVLAYRGSKAIEHAWNRRTAAISFGLLICAWLLLRRLPQALLELAQDSSLRSLPAIASADIQGLLLALVVPLAVAAVAYVFARQAVEAHPQVA